MTFTLILYERGRVIKRTSYIYILKNDLNELNCRRYCCAHPMQTFSQFETQQDRKKNLFLIRNEESCYLVGWLVGWSFSH